MTSHKKSRDWSHKWRVNSIVLSCESIDCCQPGNRLKAHKVTDIDERLVVQILKVSILSEETLVVHQLNGVSVGVPD